MQKKKKNKTKVKFSNRKIIEQSRMRQSKIKSKVYESIASIPRAINFGGDDVADLTSVTPIEALITGNKGVKTSDDTSNNLALKTKVC